MHKKAKVWYTANEMDTNSTKDTVNIKEAAGMLNVSERHVYKLLERGMLTRSKRPLYKKHGPVGIPRAEVEALLRRK